MESFDLFFELSVGELGVLNEAILTCSKIYTRASVKKLERWAADAIYYPGMFYVDNLNAALELMKQGLKQNMSLEKSPRERARSDLSHLLVTNEKTTQFYLIVLHAYSTILRYWLFNRTKNENSERMLEDEATANLLYCKILRKFEQTKHGGVEREEKDD